MTGFPAISKMLRQYSYKYPAVFPRENIDDDIPAALHSADISVFAAQPGQIVAVIVEAPQIPRALILYGCLPDVINSHRIGKYQHQGIRRMLFSFLAISNSPAQA